MGGCCQVVAPVAAPPVRHPAHRDPPASPAASAGSCATGMVLIPAGTFWMGLPPGGGANSSETPEHRVTVEAYCIDRTEVTVGAYRNCHNAGGCTEAGTAAVYLPAISLTAVTAVQRRAFGAYCNANFSDHEAHPVNCVDWAQADAFCRWRAARLPTESEWEYAARGTDRRLYPWGNAPPDPTRLNGCGSECRIARDQVEHVNRAAPPDAIPWTDGWVGTAPVGSFPAGASPFGLLDMAGNVWEWTSSHAVPYSGAPDPAMAMYRVTRGGSAYSDSDSQLRASSTFRTWDPDVSRYPTVGFRCASAVSR